MDDLEWDYRNIDLSLDFSEADKRDNVAELRKILETFKSFLRDDNMEKVKTSFEMLIRIYGCFVDRRDMTEEYVRFGLERLEIKDKSDWKKLCESYPVPKRKDYCFKEGKKTIESLI